MNTAAPQAKHAKPRSAYSTEAEANAASAKIGEYLSTAKKITGVLMTIGGLALVFTMINVTVFATAHHTPWYIAWLLDPMVSLGLIAVLYFDGRLMELGPYQASGWVLTMRYFTFFATWAMNVWSSLYPDGTFTGLPANPDHAGILLHSTPPLLVFIMAEASTKLRIYINGQVVDQQKIIDSYNEGLKAQAAAEAARAEAEEAEEEARAEAEDERQREEEREERRIALATKKAVAEADAEEAKAKAKAVEMEAAAAAEAARIKAQADADAERQRVEYELDKKAKDDEAERQQRAADAERQAREADAERQRQEAADAERQEKEQREAEQAERERKRQERRQRRAADRQTAETPQETAQDAETGDETDQNGRVVQMSREERRAHQEAAVEDAAKLIINYGGKDKLPMTTTEFGARHGKGSTWGRQRIAEAADRLAADKEFYDRMETAALEEMVKVG